MGRLSVHARLFALQPRDVRATRSWRQPCSPAGIRRNITNLPAQIALLERYRGLVALGRVQEDEEQVRVIMQVSIPVSSAKGIARVEHVFSGLTP